MWDGLKRRVAITTRTRGTEVASDLRKERPDKSNSMYVYRRLAGQAVSGLLQGLGNSVRKRRLWRSCHADSWVEIGEQNDHRLYPGFRTSAATLDSEVDLCMSHFITLVGHAKYNHENLRLRSRSNGGQWSINRSPDCNISAVPVCAIRPLSIRAQFSHPPAGSSADLSPCVSSFQLKVDSTAIFFKT